MSFLVLGRQHICRPEYTPELPHIVISVTDPNEPEALYLPTNMRRDILRLSFFDINEPIGNLTMVSNDDIEQIVEFVTKWKDEVPLIVTQCEAGISRSSGIAAIAYARLRHHLGLPKQPIRDRKSTRLNSSHRT